jgi:hypothetical protein
MILGNEILGNGLEHFCVLYYLVQNVLQKPKPNYSKNGVFFSTRPFFGFV